MRALEEVTPIQQHRILGISTLAFTVCFAVWTIFSIIGVQIKQDLGLNDTEFGLLVATPIPSGSLSRILLGIWTDQYGGRIVYTLLMLAAAVATWLLSTVETYPMFLLAALGVGLAGGSFAAGIAYVSRWYPKERQGTALGIFGVGNVGAAVTKFVAPFVMVAFGWTAVAQVWAVALVVMALVFWFTTDDDPVIAVQRRRRERPQSAMLQLAPLRRLQVWRFSLYYFFVFGAFVALALWLPRYYVGASPSTSRRRACSARSTRCRPACSGPMAAGCRTAAAHARSCTGPLACRSPAPFSCPIRRPTTSSTASRGRSRSRSPSAWCRSPS